VAQGVVPDRQPRRHVHDHLGR